MNQRDRRALEILRQLGGRPATPFFEAGPARYVEQCLREMGVDHRRDPFGNIIAHHNRGEYPHRPAVALVAHMDHPGFEIVEAKGRRAVARAVGGVPVASLVKPTPVLVLTLDGRRIPAITARHETTTDPGDRRAEQLVNLVMEGPVELDPPAPVVFDLPDFELDGDTIRMRALDDLAGCAGILAALERTVADGAECDVYGVFTRAEEGGLYGARLLAESGILPADTIVVSVESSSVIPGVAQGEGPVIRTGDAASTFDAGAEQVLIAARGALRGRDAEFKSQRQLMSGGVCEATAFAAFGYPVTGLAFPLGNYHNATTGIGDPEGGVAAEYIELSDFLDGVDLLTEAARSAAPPDDTSLRRLMGDVPDEVRQRLEASNPLLQNLERDGLTGTP
jgi:putative aminopeptidase FrvX